MVHTFGAAHLPGGAALLVNNLRVTPEDQTPNPRGGGVF